MERVLQGLPKILCYLDDNLLMGSTDEEHLDNLEMVLLRLHTREIWENKGKCKFVCARVEYWGHLIDATKLHTTESKVQAVKEAPCPKNIGELRLYSYTGLFNYYRSFFFKNYLNSFIHSTSYFRPVASKSWLQRENRPLREPNSFWLQHPF